MDVIDVQVPSSRHDVYPTLSERQYWARRRREVPLVEGFGAETDLNSVSALDMVELNSALDNLYDLAHLTYQERLCFQTTLTMSVEDAAVELKLGAKTVRRRLSAAQDKLRAVIDAQLRIGDRWLP